MANHINISAEQLFRHHLVLALASVCLLIACSVEGQLDPKLTNKNPNFHSFKDCIYAFMNDGNYLITFPDSAPQTGSLMSTKMTFDESKSQCFSDTAKQVSVFMNFDLGDNNMHSMNFEFKLRNLSSNYQWDTDGVTLVINPTGHHFTTRTIELKPVVDIYAPIYKSFSCSSLVLQSHMSNTEPHFKITFKRFQLQPFKESALAIFAPSRDCSTWLTMPQIMGFLLILFIIFTALFGVYILLELGNQQGEIKFSKQAGMLMNQAQLDATKAD